MRYLKKKRKARIIKLDTQIFHDELWKLIYVGVGRSHVMTRKSIAGMGLCTIVSEERLSYSLL